jgi:murein DD-endopeptidase MepM/ murein hydrolase activator NlpD
VVRRWRQPARLPYQPHRLRWNGIISDGRAAASGRYRFKLEARGHRVHRTRRFHLYDAEFPVRSRHDYGGPVQRFGAPRSGGRVHQGQDVFARCGTPVVAARGGRVQARGFDPELYGNWVVIDARGTSADYRYAHFLRPASARDGERVRTGGRVARVGRTGNARSVGCQLHLEIWPSGWHHGRPVDPLPLLRRWDRWS